MIGDCGNKSERLTEKPYDMVPNSRHDYLIDATRYYYSQTEPALDDEGNYWHYVDGVITIWEK